MNLSSSSPAEGDALFTPDGTASGLVLLAPGGGQDHRTPWVAAHARLIADAGWTTAVIRSLDQVPGLLAAHAGDRPVGLIGVGQGARLGATLLTAESGILAAVLAPVGDLAVDDGVTAALRFVPTHGGLADPGALVAASRWLLDRLVVAPLVCIAGGPLLPPAYLGDLGGLDAEVPLLCPDLRDEPELRCDLLVGALERLREQRGLERIALLAHSAGANLAYRYAEKHPDRVSRLLLITPSTRAVGIEITDDARSEIARLRAGEPWYAEAAAALARVQSGAGTEADWTAITPLTFGRWDDETRAYAATVYDGQDDRLVAAFTADGAFDPPVTRAALAELDVPVLVLAGAHDAGNPPTAMAEVAALFPRAELVVQERAGHFPWHDDPERFASLVTPLLSS